LGFKHAEGLSLENEGHQLVLLAGNKRADQLAEVPGQDGVQRLLLRLQELKKFVQQHVLAHVLLRLSLLRHLGLMSRLASGSLGGLFTLNSWEFLFFHLFFILYFWLLAFFLGRLGGLVLGLRSLGGNYCLFFGVHNVGLDLLCVLVDRAEINGLGWFGLVRLLETGR
jgi:hypothetical protein